MNANQGVYAMAKVLSGPTLNRLRDAGVFQLDWDGERFACLALGGPGMLMLTPDELAELSRELLRASVIKE
jgi:hypothetical protein